MAGDEFWVVVREVGNYEEKTATPEAVAESQAAAEAEATRLRALTAAAVLREAKLYVEKAGPQFRVDGAVGATIAGRDLKQIPEAAVLEAWILEQDHSGVTPRFKVQGPVRKVG